MFFIIILFFTLSRGGVLTFIIIFIYIFNFTELLAKKQNWIIGILLILIILLFFLFLYNTDLSSVYINRYLNYDLTGSGRTKIWHNTLEKIFNDSSSFLFGNGPGTFKYEIYLGKIMNSTHNQYLDFLYNFGFIGFSLFFGYLLYIINKIFNTPNNNIKKVLLSIFLIYFSSFIFDSHLWIVQTNWIFGLFLASAIKYLNIIKG
jgi:O-antigen ligase